MRGKKLEEKNWGKNIEIVEPYRLEFLILGHCREFCTMNTYIGVRVCIRKKN